MYQFGSLSSPPARMEERDAGHTNRHKQRRSIYWFISHSFGILAAFFTGAVQLKQKIFIETGEGIANDIFWTLNNLAGCFERNLLKRNRFCDNPHGPMHHYSITLKEMLPTICTEIRNQPLFQNFDIFNFPTELSTIITFWRIPAISLNVVLTCTMFSDWFSAYLHRK